MQRLQSSIAGLDYDARCRQMQAVGGDFYNFVPLAENRLAIAIGDASGKGLPAALMVSNVQSSLRTAALFAADDPLRVIDAVNRQLYEASLAERYATLFYGVFDAAAYTLRYVNAGHHAPVLVRRDGSIIFLESGGAPVGMFPDWTYQEGTIRLRSGDLLLAYTDGVVEATNTSGDEWGVDDLLRAVASCDGRQSDEIIDRVFAALDEYTRAVQTDDATVMVMQVSTPR